jgi:hypothetical protein
MFEQRQFYACVLKKHERGGRASIEKEREVQTHLIEKFNLRT